MFKGSLALAVACGKALSYSHPYLILNLDIISKPFGEKSKEISQQNQIHKLVIIIGLMEF